MTSSRGWTSDWTEVQQAQFLVWLQQDDHTGEHLQAFVEQQERGLDQRALQEIVNRCKAEGLIHEEAVLAGIEYSSAFLTDVGSRRVQTILANRRKRRLRRAACREAILDWLDSVDDGPTPTDVHAIFGDPRALFEGNPFTFDELESAGQYLRERGLITGIPIAERAAPLQPALTSEGRDCIDHYDGNVSAVTAWGQPATRSGGPTFEQNIGTVYGQAAQGHHVEQTQHGAIDLAQVQPLLQRMRDAMEGLSDDDRDDVDLQIRDLEAEATKPIPDHELVVRRVGRLQRLAERVGSPALAAAVGTTTTELLRLIGLSA